MQSGLRRVSWLSSVMDCPLAAYFWVCGEGRRIGVTPARGRLGLGDEGGSSSFHMLLFYGARAAELLWKGYTIACVCLVIWIEYMSQKQSSNRDTQIVSMQIFSRRETYIQHMYDGLNRTDADRSLWSSKRHTHWEIMHY